MPFLFLPCVVHNHASTKFIIKNGLYPYSDAARQAYSFAMSKTRHSTSNLSVLVVLNASCSYEQSGSQNRKQSQNGKSAAESASASAVNADGGAAHNLVVSFF